MKILNICLGDASTIPIILMVLIRLYIYSIILYTVYNSYFTWFLQDYTYMYYVCYLLDNVSLVGMKKNPNCKNAIKFNCTKTKIIQQFLLRSINIHSHVKILTRPMIRENNSNIYYCIYKLQQLTLLYFWNNLRNKAKVFVWDKQIIIKKDNLKTIDN